MSGVHANDSEVRPPEVRCMNRRIGQMGATVLFIADIEPFVPLRALGPATSHPLPILILNS